MYNTHTAMIMQCELKHTVGIIGPHARKSLKTQGDNEASPHDVPLEEKSL